jgi:DNA-binding CsgD family transcriptional regulator
VAKVETRLARVRGWAVSLGALLLFFIALAFYYRLLVRSKEEGRYTAAVEALVETDADIRSLTENVSSDKAAQIISLAQKPLSAVERKYILLFMSGKSTEEVAEVMHVAPASVYTMKYRIKKKYPDSFPLPF